MAAEIEAAVAEAIAAVGRELRQRVEETAPRARVTWVPTDRLHFTLRFIGEVDGVQAAAVRAALAAPVAVRAFDLTIAGLGAFPERGAPRVLWVGVGDGREEMMALERELGGRLRHFHLKAEATSHADAAYMPHLTLARLREAGGLRTRGLFDGLMPHPIGPSRIGAITLFESRLSPKGPTYLALQRLALEGGPEGPPLRSGI